MVYTARIRFVDDGSERNVSISDLLGEENLPYGYFDEDIFFYGLSQEQAKKALLSQEPCEGEWIILELDDLITGEVRPCRLEGTDVISGASVKEDEVQFWGVYRNNPDGTHGCVKQVATRSTFFFCSLKKLL